MGFREGHQEIFNFPYANMKWFVEQRKNTKILLFHTGFFFNGEFSPLDERKGLQTVQEFFLENKRNFATFGGEKKVLELAILRA